MAISQEKFEKLKNRYEELSKELGELYHTRAPKFGRGFLEASMEHYRQFEKEILEVLNKHKISPSIIFQPECSTQHNDRKEPFLSFSGIKANINFLVRPIGENDKMDFDKEDLEIISEKEKEMAKIREKIAKQIKSMRG